jgi:class 3 adenylate cyclase/tetratricopeptide (TPR) repeat protein
MNCPYCGTSNPAQARFCLGCGRPLVSGLVCPACHTLLPAHAHFCFHCGAIVVSAVQPTSSPPVRAAEPAPPSPAAPSISVPATPPTAVTGLAQLALSQLPPPRPIQDMLPSLQRYLPHDLYEPLQRRPTERNLVQACDRLTALLRTAKTYLPYPVVLAPQPAGEPAGGLYQGTFLFVDVSGFTPLSERLSQLGQDGAVQITAIINDLFFDTVSILFDHGGTLLKFGGDALLGLFLADSAEAMAENALRAVQAASAMQAAMSKFAAIEAGGETCALRIKCGVSSGRFFAAHIGTKQSMAYVTTGHTVNHADQAESHAQPGDVVIAQSTLDLLGDRVQVEPRDKGFYLVQGIAPMEGRPASVQLDEPPEGDLQAQITYLVERMDRLAPYLPAELLPRIVTNPEGVRITPDHRRVTVMFANYVGVGDLIDDLGASHPELITGHLNDYFVHMARIVEKYEGTVGRMDQYSVGDRLVIFFGAPRAHEDDPVRAVYTALDMQAATRQYFAALQTPEGVYRFRQRIGINTGHLFAGNVGAPDLRQEYTLMGDDINMAARLMSMAQWGETLISDRTQAQVAAFFDVEDRGQLKVKGKRILIPTFQVRGRREKIGRTRGLASGDSPLVDRGDELLALQSCGQKLLSGRGQIVSIIGDSGLGKSRLMRELKVWLFGKGGADEIVWLEGYALSFSEQMSYWLAVQILRGLLGIGADTSQDDTLFTLWDRSEDLLGKEIAREAVPFLAHLLDLPLKGEWARWVQELDPKVRQRQTFWAARELLAAAARQRPTVIAVDDLHWADEASLALLGDLLEVTDRAPLMFCLIFRERRDKGCWHLRDRAAGNYPHRYTEVALQPLTEAHSRQLLCELVPGAVFEATTERRILDKATGNPFYLEEVIRSLQEQKVIVPDDAAPNRWKVQPGLTEINVPDSLQGAILARIDRLTEDARQALQMAAVIGRRFQAQVLLGLIRAEAELETWLAQLERSNLIRPAQLEPEPVYAFPDALVQEVAYGSLLAQRRLEFHRRVGETLEALHADRRDQECELLAYHFGRSDDRPRAIRYLEMAGHKAQAEFANETAVRHYTDLLTLLGEQEATWEKRFDVLLRRQQVYGLVGQQEARENDLQAMLSLAEAHDDDARRADALTELADLYQWIGRYAEAQDAARQALSLKTKLGDPVGQAAALHQLGVLSYYRGDYEPAQASLERAVSLRQQANDAAGAAWSLMYLGMIHFFQGDYGRAAEHHELARQVAQARQDWFQEGIHLTNAARVSLRLGEYEQALELFERSLEMKRRVGDRTGQGFSLFYKGLVHTYLGGYDDAESAFQASLDLRRQINDERGIGYSLHGLGLVALGRGQFELAADYFQQAYQIHSQLGAKAETVVDLSYLGQARLGLDKLDEAAEASGQAIALLAEQKNVEEAQQVYLNHFRVLAARQERSARDFLQEAYNVMARQADCIGDAEKRQRFLEKVKVNREIVAAMEK